MVRRTGNAAIDARKAAVLAAIAGAALCGGPETAWAASDSTFAGPLDTATDMVSGTGGQLAAALAVGAALVGSVLRFNAVQILGAADVGIELDLPPNVTLDVQGDVDGIGITDEFRSFGGRLELGVRF